MGRIGRGVGAVVRALLPRSEYIRALTSLSLDSLTTYAYTLVAIVLAVGYQVMIRIGPRLWGDRR